MSTDTTLQIISTDLEETLALASQIGQRLRGGESIELVSDLGGGKTAFVRGLAKGMGSSDRVSSPSFTLSNEYQSDTLTLHHFDFYRLHDPGIMAQELSEFVDDPVKVVVVEWAGIVEGVLPADKVAINIEVIDENSRRIIISCPSELAYLTENINNT